MDFTEPARARRFRDRRRILQKTLRIASRQHSAPVSGDPVTRVIWTDISGQRRHGLTSWDDVTAIRVATASRRWQHLAACSCNLCGNPRRWFHAMTRQETLADVDTREQFAEVGRTYQARFSAYS